MPQSTSELLQGYLRLIGDTLSQRFVNRSPPPGHPLFSTSSDYLSGQTALVTGANTGIGLETARMLAGAGATVILACRNPSKAESAAAAIRKAVPHAHLQVELLDLSSHSSVRSCVAAFASRSESSAAPRPLHMLVLNGGVMGALPASPETHFLVNHVGHALITLNLLPHLAAAGGPGARVVLVSSLTCVVSDLRWDDLDFQTRTYNWMTAYANSKLAMILFMKALVQRLGDAHIVVNAVHPGEATSDVARHLGRVWMWLHQNVGNLFLLSTAESARTSVYIAGAKEAARKTGNIFHRVWHAMHVPDRLLADDDVEQLWRVTLETAGVTEKDMEGLVQIVRANGGDESLVRLPH